MDKINEIFLHDGCEITIQFTPIDKYGVDRHYIFINRPMCPIFKAQSFEKNANDIRNYARELTCFVRTTCG